MKCNSTFALALLLGPCFAWRACGEDAVKPKGDPVAEAATLHSLGFYWVVQGDDNRNARIETHYRKKGAEEWRQGPPLFRVEKGGNKLESGNSKVNPPRSAWLFAGSLLLLEPNTDYEVKLTLNDPDGGGLVQALALRTAAEPMLAADAPRVVRHVVPGEGGGSGTKEDPYKGLPAAQAEAKPDQVILVHAGVYKGTFLVEKSGSAGKPIVWRGAGDGEAVLDAKADDGSVAERGISAGDIHDVWFEDLSIRNANYGMVLHRSYGVVVRRCHIHQVEYGLTFTNNANDKVRDIFIADCLIEGPSVWPRCKGIENARGIQATGTGIEVCYNRIRGFADAIDTFGSQRCCAIDFHHNELSELTDDGIEMDYSERNTRCFYNRLTNCFQGISLQPVHGGPIYVFRNAMYNIVSEPFKLHNNPSGGLIFHNTCVKKNAPIEVMSGGTKVTNTLFRNNLFIGTESTYAFELTTQMVNCDFDYDGFGGGPWRDFLKWNEVRYKTLDEVKVQKAPAYQHALLVTPDHAFASGLKPPEDEKKQAEPSVNDPRLKKDSEAIDAGEPRPGFNDGFAGKAPDLGAYEFGAELPHFGPRTVK